MSTRCGMGALGLAFAALLFGVGGAGAQSASRTKSAAPTPLLPAAGGSASVGAVETQQLQALPTVGQPASGTTYTVQPADAPVTPAKDAPAPQTTSPSTGTAEGKTAPSSPAPETAAEGTTSGALQAVPAYTVDAAATGAGVTVQTEPAGAPGGKTAPAPAAPETAAGTSGGTEAAPAPAGVSQMSATLPSGVSAQDFVPVLLTGRVYDEKGRPLVGVAVTAVQGASVVTARVDASGTYALRLPVGEWAVSVSDLDYDFRPARKVYRVAGGAATRVE